VLAAMLSNGAAALVLIALVAACVFRRIGPPSRRHADVISEWSVSLDGKGWCADDVFEHVVCALKRRHAPVQYRVLSLPDASAEDYLHVRLGAYDGYLSAFAFGDDLFVGWTLWFGARHWDLRSRGAGGPEAWHGRDLAKALCETLHSVAREGVEAAVGTVPFQREGTIGTPVPRGASPGFAGTLRAIR
jgi:hypothetical protein